MGTTTAHRSREVVAHGSTAADILPGITQKMLTQQLRQLETDGLVDRTMHPEVPPRVEYSLTSYGQSLQEMLDLICGWGEEHARRAGITLVKPPPAPVGSRG